MTLPFLPTVREESSAQISECARARLWRVNVARLSVEELAELIGYSSQMVYLLERGIDSRGRHVKARAWQKYKRMCAGLCVKFNWNRKLAPQTEE